MKRFYCILLAVVLLVQVDAALATVVYQGKSGDIFEPGSSVVAHQETVHAIIGKVGQAKGVGMLQIQLTLAVFADTGEKTGDLAEERCQVLKSAINTRYSALRIECDTETKHLNTPVQALGGANLSSKSSVDNLILQMVPIAAGQVGGANAGNKPAAATLDPWLAEIRKRYEAIVAKHKDCEWFPPPKYCDIKCETQGKNGCYTGDPGYKEFALCMIRGPKCELVAGSHYCTSIQLVEYEIEKIRALQEETEIVYGLAVEIEKKTGRKNHITYDPFLFKKTIDNNEIALKYLRRAIKVAELGIRDMSKVSGCKAEELQSVFSNWININVFFSQFYQDWYRLAALNNAKQIHDFVRSSIGVPDIINPGEFPICIYMGQLSLKESTMEKESIKLYEESLMFSEFVYDKMSIYGYHELPLE
ncbi:hypothetical protein [Desulfogranum japonicum]|uniref:hypothetical protein n=1 Tax=Desulfogranum japonicum TaxID=231447 RepID=UPI00040D757A|nr:hypothetical protein [Desulfogranum japonicum]